jgi:DNA invertase Pin-like site-specific DNA recombinase
VLDFAALMARADRRGWCIVVLGVNVDTTSATGELMATVVAAFAHYERRLIGQQTKDALVAKKAAGVVLGRPRTVDHSLRERIITERAAGRSLREDRRSTNHGGREDRPGGRRWYASTVRHVALESEAAV